MDTSKLLRNTTDILRPYIDSLGFTELRHLIQDFTDVVNGQECVFRYFSENRTMVPYGFCNESIRMHPFDISRTIRAHGGSVKKVYYVRLLLRKSLVGGAHTSWYLQWSEFRPTSGSHTYFDLHSSSIVSINDEELNEYGVVLTDLETRLYDQIRTWIGVSRQKRQSHLMSLKKLESLLPDKG